MIVVKAGSTSLSSIHTGYSFNCCVLYTAPSAQALDVIAKRQLFS
jgi:hypothetical protein